MIIYIFLVPQHRFIYITSHGRGAIICTGRVSALRNADGTGAKRIIGRGGSLRKSLAQTILNHQERIL